MTTLASSVRFRISNVGDENESSMISIRSFA